jgi:hypothetical protein
MHTVSSFGFQVSSWIAGARNAAFRRQQQLLRFCRVNAAFQSRFLLASEF